MTISLSAEKRTILGRDNWKTRTAGQVPAVVYGSKIEPKNIAVNLKALIVALRGAGESSLVDLAINGDQPLKVLIQDVQKDPMTGEIIHVDFRAVDLTKEIVAEIKLEFIGESPAVKGLGGILIEAMNTLEVRALPTALVSSIQVDISMLKTFDDTIRVSDLILPAGITAVKDLNETVAVVEEPRTEEEIAELSKAVEIDVAAVEVEKKGPLDSEASLETSGKADVKDEKKKDEKKDKK